MTGTRARAGLRSTPPANAGGSRSRIDEVTDRLIAAIAIGEYLPGSRLPSERHLAESLGVGRMTARSAIARLVEHGLLETQRGRSGGSFVVEQWNDTSGGAVHRVLEARWAHLLDQCDAIARLHGALARAAAERRTADDVALLHRRLEGYRNAAGGLAKQQADARLHAVLIDAARNHTLSVVLHELEADLSIGAPAHLWGEPSGMTAMENRALGEHEALVAAVSDQRADEAEAIARAHVGIDRELLEAARERAAGFSPDPPTAPPPTRDQPTRDQPVRDQPTPGQPTSGQPSSVVRSR